ncbi:efflux RND transporter periplasmic adaptor subunit [Pseudomonas sp. 21LCFQ010]|uniref:efflux RND transporter periplasmic adaptor subunit n=1 Tax=unclassified Pseudomonas TaxID=196821 RepID=UPI0004F8ABD9|nr:MULTISPECIES: efflux RND transporter periplasmic adaptor subunit [unclassified Pseudomonas]MCO8165889.1 efflux RND transporter periplasmic adaptor subunit [Pseudomonas sp. 21LCFQ010]BAP45804.1 cation efflux family protein [Pseudomonas sp. StFLB209]
MNNKRSLAIAVALVALGGIGSLTLNDERGAVLASAQAAPAGHEAHDHDHPEPANADAPKPDGQAHARQEEHKDDDGHKDEQAHGADEHGNAEQGADEHGHEEEQGQVELSAEQIRAAGIELAVATTRPLNLSASFPGEIRFDEDRTAHIVPRVSGVVERVMVELGQQVKKGQVLAVISSPQIADQRSELSAAQRRLETAGSTLQREKTLWQDKISAEQDYQLARQAYQEAQINVANARQKLSVIGAGLSPDGGNRYELVAPFDAMIVEKHLSIGEVVNEASNAFTLSDLSRVWATFGVTAKDLDKVMIGREVVVTAPDLNAQVQGKVGYVGNLLGELSRTAQVRVTLANPQGAWRPGLLVNIEVATADGQAALSVPEAALQTVENNTVVFLRNAEGFKAQPVMTGRRANGHVEVLGGLQAGAQIAAAGSFVLKSELGKGSAEHSH